MRICTPDVHDPSTSHIRTVSTLRVGALLMSITLSWCMLAQPAAAQSVQDRTLIGQAQDSQGSGLADVTVRLTRDSDTRIARTDQNGRYRISGLTDGVWTLTAQRIGYAPYVTQITVSFEGVRHDVVLSPRTNALDSVLVTARWTGVRGVAYDARSFTPLTDARITVVGTSLSDSSDEGGAFAIEVARPQTAIVRVERPGFLSVMRSVVIPEGRYVEIDMPLDTANSPPKDLIDQKDLQLRLASRGTFSAVIPREELVRTGARNALDALTESPSGIQRSLLIGREACVFVNGRARPGFPIDAVQVADVEFIEAYPPGSDFSNTLERRWPSGAPCGVPTSLRQRGESAKGRVRYVSVWLKP